MTRNIIILLSVSLNAHTLFAAGPERALITLPDKQWLESQLQRAANCRFIQRSNLSARLANKTFSPDTLAKMIELIVFDYEKYLLNPEAKVSAGPQTSRILWAILRNHPDALRCLQNRGMYTPFL